MSTRPQLIFILTKLLYLPVWTQAFDGSLFACNTLLAGPTKDARVFAMPAKQRSNVRALLDSFLGPENHKEKEGPKPLPATPRELPRNCSSKQASKLLIPTRHCCLLLSWLLPLQCASIEVRRSCLASGTKNTARTLSDACLKLLCSGPMNAYEHPMALDKDNVHNELHTWTEEFLKQAQIVGSRLHSSQAPHPFQPFSLLATHPLLIHVEPYPPPHPRSFPHAPAFSSANKAWGKGEAAAQGIGISGRHAAALSCKMLKNITGYAKLVCGHPSPFSLATVRTSRPTNNYCTISSGTGSADLRYNKACLHQDSEPPINSQVAEPLQLSLPSSKVWRASPLQGVGTDVALASWHWEVAHEVCPCHQNMSWSMSDEEDKFSHCTNCRRSAAGRLILIHLQCWEELPFWAIQRQWCIKILCPKDPEFYTPLALNSQKGQHLPALKVYKNQSPNNRSSSNSSSSSTATAITTSPLPSMHGIIQQIYDIYFSWQSYDGWIVLWSEMCNRLVFCRLLFGTDERRMTIDSIASLPYALFKFTRRC